MRKGYLITLILISLMMVACGGSDSVGIGRRDALDGKAWLLFSLNGADPMTGELGTIYFEFSDGNMTGDSSCHYYNGQYSIIDEDTISFEQVATTEANCLEPEGLMAQEQLYFEILRDAERWEIKDYQLTIYDSLGRILIYDELGEG